MIKALGGTILEFDIDPNPNGLPVLFILTKLGIGGRILSSTMLSKLQTEELIKELQRKLREMEL